MKTPKKTPLFFPLLIGALAVSNLVASSDETSYGGWKSSRIGGGGYIVDLIPTSNAQVYYTHTDVGGFYRSDDGGATWRMLQGALPATRGNQEPRSLVVDPRDPNTILVANGSHWQNTREGVFRSTDGGQTFERTLEAAFAGNGNERMWGRVLAVDPNNPDVVLAGSMGDGVFRSADFGKTWQNVGLDKTNPTDIKFDTLTKGRVLLTSRPYRFFLLGKSDVVLNPGFFESTDSGKTWSALITDKNAPFEMLQAPAAFGYDWIAIFPPCNVMRSKDGGHTWSPFEEGLPQDTAGHKANIIDASGVITPWGSIAPFTISALAAGPDFLLAGAGDGSVFRRGKNDAGWQKVPGRAVAPETWYGNSGNRPGWVQFGKAIATLVVDPRDPTTWWMADWFMLWKSKDSGKLWNYSGDGLEVTCLHNITQAADDPGLVHMGMADNGYFRSTDGGASFSQVWKVITNNIKDIAVSPIDPSRLYAIGNAVNGHWYSSQVFVSDDRGTSWRAAAMGGTRDVESRRNNSVAADPNARDTVYVTIAGKPGDRGGVFRSTDAGESWTPLNDGLPDEPLFRADIWHVGREIAASKDGTLVAFSHDLSRVFAFDPKTASWTEVVVPMKTPNAVAADPFVSGRYLLAAREGGVFVSEDGGKIWTPAGISTDSRHVAFDKVKAGRVAVGTHDGVSLSTDGGKTWSSLNKALPNRFDNMVAFAGDRVVVGSSGAGAFWFPLTPEAAKPVQSSTVKTDADKVSAKEEVLKNGDFKDGAELIVPEGWKLRWSDVGAIVDGDTATFFSPPASLRVRMDQTGTATVEQELPPDLQGKWLTVSGKVRIDGDYKNNSIAVQYKNAEGEEWLWKSIYEPVSGRDWQEFQMVIAVPASYERASLLFHMEGSGTSWLDDVSVKVSEPQK